MLRQLYIENIAVIRKTEITLERGLNVLTGETGAGKSILIDALGLILGGRASRELVRSGSDRAQVSAVFQDLSAAAADKLAQLGIDAEDGVILSREITADGRSTCRIQGKPATAAMLREIGEFLINIHGQHDNQALLRPERHIEFIDAYAHLEAEKAAYQQLYQTYRTLIGRIHALQMDEAEKARRLDLLHFQVDELTDAKLVAGEEEELSEQRKIIQNASKISDGLMAAHAALEGEGTLPGARALIWEAAGQLSGVAAILESAGPLCGRLQSAAYELDEIGGELGRLLETIDYDPGRLEAIEGRLDLIYRLGRKYGATTGEMLDYLDRITDEMNRMESQEEQLAILGTQLETAKQQARQAATELRAKRLRAADQLAARVGEELRFLDMPKVRFSVAHKATPLSPDGADQMEFLLSVNPGEPEKPIARIASGGELSRIMLALKNVLAESDVIDTLIFDEIDTGVSGRAAQKIGIKLREAARTRQILCVTHLAQIAAQADYHLLIHKRLSEDTAETTVVPLDREGRKAELARIMGGEPVTGLMLENADELLRAAGN